jgi:hypothetical protein
MPEGSRVDDPPAMTVREVASDLNVDDKTVYRQPVVKVEHYQVSEAEIRRAHSQEVR